MDRSSTSSRSSENLSYVGALRGKTEVVHHVAFVASSIEARLAEARKHKPNIKVVFDAPLRSEDSYVYLSGMIPGMLVELIEFS